jgi:outer membrane protein assembly factor BamB
MRKTIKSGIVFMAALAGIPFISLAETGFRGDGCGQSQNVNPPLRWSQDANIVWVTKLKMSNASPVILGDRIFICEEPDVLLALSLTDGKVLWSVANGYADVLPPAEAAQCKLPVTHQVNGYTSQTPVTDGTSVYVVFGSGVVAGFTPDGKRLWGRVLPVRPHNSAWGHSASPRLADGLLLIHFGNKVFALDANTGADKWVADSPSGWGSPLVAKIDGASVLITQNGDVFAVADGRKLTGANFNFPWNGPVVQDKVVYKVDSNGAEAFELTINAGGKLPSLWKNPQVPKGRYYATSIVHDGLVYNVCQGGELIVLDAKTGAVAYQQPLNLGGTAYPSPTLAGGRLYISSDTGKTVVVKPGRVYEELARNTLPPFRSSPLFVGDSLLIRTNNGLCRIQEKK